MTPMSVTVVKAFAERYLPFFFRITVAEVTPPHDGASREASMPRQLHMAVTQLR